MQKNVTGQKWVVFAFDTTDGTAKPGDAAQITGNLRIDGAAANAIDDVNPTELEDGYYIFDITQAETNGDMILIAPASSTGNIQVIGVPGVVHTTAPNANLLSIESDGDLTKVNTLDGHTAQTGDTFALANGSAGFVAIDTVVDAILVDTSGLNGDAMRGTDSAALASVCTEGRLAELDAANLPADVDSILTDTGTTLPATLAALNDVSTAEVNAEVVDVLKTDTIADLANGAPPDTPTFEQAVMYGYSALINLIDVDSGFKEFYDKDGNLIWKKALGDDGSNYTEAKGEAGS